MPFINLGFDRPGAGVCKDEKPLPPLLNFFVAYFRKFWHLVRLNLIYFGCCFLFYIPLFAAIRTHSFGTPFFYLSLLPIFLTGPFTAGLTYVLRDFVQGRPSFLWQDFKDAAHSNIKQALVVSAIGIGAAEVFFFLLQNGFGAHDKPPFYLLAAVLCTVALFFLFMQFYLFLMMVTFRLSLGQLYKNALIFSIAGFGRNLLVTAFSTLLLAVSFLFFAARFLIPFLTLSTVGYLILFGIWPPVKQHMLGTQASVSEAENGEAPIFSDEFESPKKNRP